MEMAWEISVKVMIGRMGPKISSVIKGESKDGFNTTTGLKFSIFPPITVIYSPLESFMSLISLY